MLVKKDSNNSLKRLINKVIANVYDYDMHNLFLSKPLLDEIAEAGSGSMEILPSGTLREHNYGLMPLVVRPKYTGDFLEKLKNSPIQGKPLFSADQGNLWDFSMPSEWLKHQEQPYPRILLDEFYDINRPGDGAGYEDLKQYWDRAWDPWVAPEISEDLLMRNGPQIDEPTKFEFRSASTSDLCNTILAKYLLENFPVEVQLEERMYRVAVLLSELENSRITTKKGTMPLSIEGVKVRLIKAEPEIGRWTFQTGSGKGGPYVTIFQFIPYRNIRDVSKLNVRVSCTCNAWIYWGAQYNAHMGGYLYGEIKIKSWDGKPVRFVYPEKRDPRRKFLVCKHVLACIPLVSKYKMGEIALPVKERLKKKPAVEVLLEKHHKKVPIPSELIEFGRHPAIVEAIKKWKKLTPEEKKSLIMRLNAPGEIAYLGFSFPEVLDTVIEKLTTIAKTAESQHIKEWAEKLLSFWV